MNRPTFFSTFLSRWFRLPGALRWHGSTATVGVLAAVALRAMMAGPTPSRADTAAPMRHPADQLPRLLLDPTRLPTTAPTERNLFSLQWAQRPAVNIAAAPADDPAFWHDVEAPLKQHRSKGNPP